MTTIYKVSDDSWLDGHEDCPCCSGLKFECYNAVNWNQNGSACSKEQLYRDILLEHLTEGRGYEDNLYQECSEGELEVFIGQYDIKVEWV